MPTDKSFDVVDLISNNADSLGPNLAETVLEGLTKKEKRLPSWLIFDDEGSRIFEEITELEHYQPAMSEFEIFRTHKQAIAALLPTEPFQLIELGAGDARKSKVLLEYFVQNKIPFHYAPLDISAGAVRSLVDSLACQFQDTALTVTGVAATYFQGLEWILKQNPGPNVVFFLGSTLGNHELPAASDFLRALGQALHPGDLTLIGFDLLKHPKILYRAYNDAAGVFEKFNLHLLTRLNRDLGANFNTDQFVQQGSFNWRTRAVESYLYSMRDQTVRIDALNREFRFKHGEGMQTEHSYKYTIEEIETLARDNGFEVVQHLFDARRHYVDSIWKVVG